MDYFNDSDLTSFDAPASAFEQSTMPIAQRKRQAQSGSLPGLFDGSPVRKQAPPAGAMFSGGTQQPTSARPSVFGTLAASRIKAAHPMDSSIAGGGPDAAANSPPGRPIPQIPKSVAAVLTDVVAQPRKLTDMEIGELRGVLKMNVDMNPNLARNIVQKLKSVLMASCFERITTGMEELNSAEGISPLFGSGPKGLDSYGEPSMGAGGNSGSYGEPFNAGMPGFTDFSAPTQRPGLMQGMGMGSTRAPIGLLGNQPGPDFNGTTNGGPFPRFSQQNQGGMSFGPRGQEMSQSMGPRMPMNMGQMGPRGPMRGPPGPGSMRGPRPPGPMARPPGPMGMRPRLPGGPGHRIRNPFPPNRHHLFDMRTLGEFTPPNILACMRDLNICPPEKFHRASTKPLRNFFFSGIFKRKLNPFPFVALCYAYLPEVALDELMTEELQARLLKSCKEWKVAEKELGICKSGRVPQVLPPILAMCKPLPKKRKRGGTEKTAEATATTDEAQQEVGDEKSEEKNEEAVPTVGAEDPQDDKSEEVKKE